jgi:hypothetical protein
MGSETGREAIGSGRAFSRRIRDGVAVSVFCQRSEALRFRSVAIWSPHPIVGVLMFIL